MSIIIGAKRKGFPITVALGEQSLVLHCVRKNALEFRKWRGQIIEQISRFDDVEDDGHELIFDAVAELTYKILEGWEGVVDEKDAPITFSATTLKSLLMNYPEAIQEIARHYIAAVMFPARAGRDNLKK